MFTKKITHSDEFISMPHSSQNLYFHLNMEADDEGFVNGVKRIMRTINANEDDLKILIAKRFVLVFESGVIVIKHWKLHNTIRNDRFKPTDYTGERALITEKENGIYTMCQPSDNQVTTKCQHRLDKISIEEISIDKDNTKKRVNKFTPPTLEEVTAYCLERKNNINPQYFVDYQQAREWVLSNGKKMKDWKATIRYWEQNNFSRPQSKVVDIPTYYTQKDDEEDKEELLRKLKEM